MTDYFVDAAAVGAGTGLTPANAFVSVLSVPWTNGDRAWVRRTHKEDLTNANLIGVASDATHGSSARSIWNFLIGWPDAKGAFYDVRPAAGTSASWDSDNSTFPVNTTYGINVPTLSNSNNGADGGTGVTIGPYLVLANFCLNNSGGGGAQWLWTSHNYNPWASRIVFNNIVPLFAGGPYQHVNDGNGFSAIVDKVTLVGSRAGNDFFDNGGAKAKHIVVHSASVLLSIFGSNGIDNDIGLLDVQTNSLNFISRQTTGDFFGNTMGIARRHIRRVVGLKPFSGFVGSQGLDRESIWSVDDWYGQGPQLFGGGPHKPLFAAQLAATAAYSSNPAYLYSVQSENAGGQGYSTPLYSRPGMIFPINVSSGIAVTINVPIYVDSTAVFSPSSYLMAAHLRASGTRQVEATNSSIIPGTPGLWSGTLPVGGAAYVFTSVFTPTETGVVPFELFLPPWTQTASGQGLTAYALFGAPYVGA